MAGGIEEKDDSADSEKGKERGSRRVRGGDVTLMPTLYKIYAIILAKKIKETESKGMIPHNKTGFTAGMVTIDNICVLNYLANRQLAKKKGRMIAMFVE